MTRDGDAERLQRLEDLEEIRSLAARYAHCVWHEDIEGAVETFAEDGVFATAGRDPIRGRAALLESFRDMIVGPELQPFVHNHVVELAGDRARGWCYLDLRATMQGRSVIGSGCYTDTYVRTAAGWRFASRELSLRFLAAITEGWAEPKADPPPSKR